MKKNLLFASAVIAAVFIAEAESSAQFGFPRMNMDSLNALTNADYSRMKAQLGLGELRPGKDGYSSDPAIGANYDELIANPYLVYPDPLQTFDGKKVESSEDWFKIRRPELLKEFEDNFYGHIPSDVPAVNWVVVKEENQLIGDIPCITRQLLGVVDNSSCPDIKVEIKAEVSWPEKALKDLPVIVEYGFMMGNMPQRSSWKEMVVERGWAACTIVPTSYQADGGHGLRQGIIGLCNKGGFRKPDDWGSIRAWAWGVSRLIDYFEAEPLFDASKVAVEGNSRYGKTALATAVFDERVASAFVSSSGKGGATPWRRYCGETVENLAASSEYHWMCGNFLKYAADPLNAGDMKVDQHEFIAICAPRPILVSTGTFEADHWQDLNGMYISCTLASPVYELLGVEGLKFGYGEPVEDKGIRPNVFPGMNVGLMGGRLAFRMHDGGHEPGPNWPYFLDFFDRFVVRGK